MYIANNEIIFINKKRYYVENLTERDFSLENTTPYLLKIDDIEFQETSWVELVRNLAAYLITSYLKTEDELLKFKTDWSKSNIFSKEPISNFKSIPNGLYINCNHTALHGCWLIQDLLDFYNFDKSKVYLLIHRSPSAEPKEARKYFEDKFKVEFSTMLNDFYLMPKEKINKIISNIENYMNPILAKLSKSYNSFLLFDDKLTFYNYSQKFYEEITQNPKYSEKNKTLCIKYLNYLKEFYKLS